MKMMKKTKPINELKIKRNSMDGLMEEREVHRDILVMLARESFYVFVLLMGPLQVPGFKDGAHIKVICDALQKAYETPDYRLMVNLPPGSSKSILCSVLYPAWILGREPSWQILHIGHTADFIAKFGGYIRDLLALPEYQEIFPDTKANENFQARNDWETTRRGVYRSAGAGGAIAGKRGNIGICDDIVSEQNATSKAAMETIYEWWPGGFESRLLEGGRIVYIATRWSKIDPAEWLLNRSKENPDLDQWHVIKIPALITQEAHKLLGHPVGTSFWPEVWKTDTFVKKKMGMPSSQWSALYMQEPTDAEGAIFKDSDFIRWTKEDPPEGIEMIIASLDTAFSTSNQADFSVIAIWGVFRTQEYDSEGKLNNIANIILLELHKGRWAYPDLVLKCSQIKENTNPDLWIIEKKASGQSLIQDLRRRGYFLHEYTPDKDKVTRAIAASPFVREGRLHIPTRHWAKEYIDDMVAFPKGAHDDVVDATTMAILWLRDSYVLSYEEEEGYEDEQDELREAAKNKKMYW